MAHVIRKFEADDFEVILSLQHIYMKAAHRSVMEPGGVLWLVPKTPAQAYDWALLLRRSARKLEEIGRSMK